MRPKPSRRFLLSACVTLLGCSSARSSPEASPAGHDAGDAGSDTGEDAGNEADTPSLLDDVQSRFPAADEPNACADTTLRLVFKAPVTLGTAGSIRVFDVADASTPVDAIDIAATNFTDQIGGRNFHLLHPVFIDGQNVAIRLRSHVLLPTHSYFVTIDDGVFVGADGVPLPGLSDPSGWRFTIRAAPAPSDHLVVVLDGSGDFCSVQGAVDFIPANNTSPVLVDLKNGVYREIVLISHKSSITLHGEDRQQTVIAYANNDVLQTKLGTMFRALFSAESANDLVIDNLTLKNLTPQDGSQAEALRIDPGQRVIVRNADVSSLQDTMLLTGLVYVENCTIEGNVDFIWGKGAAYFERCELRTVGRAGYNVQARNLGGYGYVFVDSKLTSDPGIAGNLLARIDASLFPQSQVAYIDCQMGPHTAPVGWLVTPIGTTATSGLRFWEYNSTDLAGQPLDVSQRLPISKQLTSTEALQLRDKATVLAGWNPTP